MSEVKVAIGQQLTSTLANFTSLLVTTTTVNSIFPAQSVQHHHHLHHHHQQQQQQSSSTADLIAFNSQYPHDSSLPAQPPSPPPSPPPTPPPQYQYHQPNEVTISDYWSINSSTSVTSSVASPLVSLTTSAFQIALNVTSLFVQGSSSSYSPLPPSHPPLTILSSSSKGEIINEHNIKGSPTKDELSLLSSFESNGTNSIANCCNHLDNNLTITTTTDLPTIGSTFDDNLQVNGNSTSSSIAGTGQGISSTSSVFNFHESPLNGQLFNLTSVFDEEITTNWTNQSSSSNLFLFNDTIINSSYVISPGLSSNISILHPNEDITHNWTTEPDLRIHHPFLAILLGIICLLVMFGNILIMVAIRRERYLHTVTNLFVASLAVADCLVGAIVMPSSVVHEVMNKWWIFGQDWCDLWHSFDVLASTASILNLCVISLDRYWAITDPISYPARMTNRKAKILIALVWTCSALISFPAILWWRAVSAPPRPLRCDFTEDVGYLLFSSIISFYGPLIIMLVVYLRIYRAAIQQTKSVKSGTKSIAAIDGNESNAVVLRIHRGGGGGGGSGGVDKGLNNNHLMINFNSQHEGQLINPPALFNLSNQSSPSHVNQRYPHLRTRFTDEVSFDESSDCTNSDGDTNVNHNNNNVKMSSSSSSSTRHPNMKTLSRKLVKLAKEKKAAKTLGIVMGVFILCWLPFFIANLVKGFCGDYCLINPDLVYPLVTWLGWLNSGMNPVIYACWSRDFRRAFKKILFRPWLSNGHFSPENKASKCKSNRSNDKPVSKHFKSIGFSFDKPKCPQNLIAIIELTSASNDVSTL